MKSILPGSRIVGKSGKILTVDRIEGDILICGDLRVKPSAVVRVIPPLIVYSPKALKIGDRVRYIGGNYYCNLKTQYAGILEVWSISNRDGYTCMKPNQTGLTSWIKFNDLELLAIE
jgi:hypothetical protein